MKKLSSMLSRARYLFNNMIPYKRNRIVINDDMEVLDLVCDVSKTIKEYRKNANAISNESAMIANRAIEKMIREGSK